MDKNQFIEKSKIFFTENGFNTQADADFDGQFRADMYAQKKGRSLGIFFPYEDHLFFHYLEGTTLRVGAHIEILHEKARKYVNSFFKLPRALRYKVPNIVTVALSGEGFPREMIDYARKPKTNLIGGERHSVILVDLRDRKFISADLETTYSGGIGITFKQVNPNNRAIMIIHEMMSSM